jgi:hypothetical protein
LSAAEHTARLRLVDALHLEPAPDGGAHVIDDRTFSAAHVNASARVILEALRQPQTQQSLQTVLAQAADCPPSHTEVPVARLMAELVSYRWVENA